jgi:arylsulfatase A-like enzyme
MTFMNRRVFLCNFLGGAAAFRFRPPAAHTHHLVFISNGGGVRKRDYYGNVSLSPNITRLARDGFVFEEDHCEAVASHETAFAELLQGREFNLGAAYPTILDYVGGGVAAHSIREIPQILEHYRPRIIVCRETAHDVGHYSYERYVGAVKRTDEAIGKVLDWVTGHPHFSRNTAIVIRPEFGRDDEVNEHGQLHHSYGFYFTHRVASIFWGPDFNQGVDRQTVVSSMDMAPTLAHIFGAPAEYAKGRIVPGLFKTAPEST